MAAHGPQLARSNDVAMLDFDSMPLFMRDLPADDSGNMAYEALQSLIFEGSPDEQARNFKEQGNDYFRGRRFREAAGFYSQGIEANPEDVVLREALLLNRAACNIELKNYGSVLRDTSATLVINPKSAKAYFRAAHALLALERYTEGLDVCERCLAFDQNNASMRSQQKKMLEGKEAQDAKENERLERIRREAQEKRMMNASFQALHLIVVNTGRVNEWAPHFDPKFHGYRTSATPVLFPVWFLYPQYNTSDVVTEFDPSSTFASHLATMFPPTPGTPLSPSAFPKVPPISPDWDRFGEYTTGNLAVYATTARSRLLKIGKRMTLRDACDAAARVPPGEEVDGLVLRDNMLTFNVVPKGEKERAWVEEYKRKLAAGAPA